ncbi:MAG: hypothetical protein LOD94_01225 [Gammaproteobacteria bacterium]
MKSIMIGAAEADEPPKTPKARSAAVASHPLIFSLSTAAALQKDLGPSKAAIMPSVDARLAEPRTPATFQLFREAHHTLPWQSKNYVK